MVDKVVNPGAAINAYTNSANIAKKGIEGGDGAQGASFFDLLRQKATDSINTIKAGEQMSAKAVTGEADITDVVQAVSAAELTLQTVVSIRDRLISAYQDIMRMPV